MREGRSSAARIGAWALAGSLALWPGLELFRFAVSSPTLPQWDMAKYGVSGSRLAAAVRDLDPLAFLARVYELDVWPPAWPLIESAAFLLFGDEVSVARGLVATSWMVLVVAVFWCLSRPFGAAAGLLAAAWVAQAPLLQALATVNLLEVPGLLFLALALGAHVRALRTETSRRQTWGPTWWRATWVATLALFFTKYNYGLMWIVPLAACELRRRSGSWREAGGRLLRRVRRLPWRRPLAVFVVAYTAALLVLWMVLRWTGGGSWTAFGLPVRLTSVGTPAYALYVGLSLYAGLRLRRNAGELRRHLDRATHGAFSWLVLPIAAWFLLPPHLKELLGFVGNRSSGVAPWSVEFWTFYPGIVVENFAVAPWLGVVVLAAALPGLCWILDASAERRIVALTTAVAWMAILVHPYRLPRFAVQAAVLTGLLAACVIGSRLGGTSQRSGLRLGKPRQGDAGRRGVAVAVVVLICAATLWHGAAMERVRAQHGLRTVPGSLTPAVDLSARAALAGSHVLGVWNLHSPSLVEWRARHLAEVDSAWRPAGRREVSRQADLEAVTLGLRDPSVRSVVWIESDHPSWRQENGWLAPLGGRIARSPAARRQAAITAGLRGEGGEDWFETVSVYLRVD